MKYSRSALGLLNAQYRSVLRKCFLINVGVFALGMTAAQAAVTVDDYQKVLDALADSADADIIFNANGNGIDLNGANGLTVGENQKVAFENIGTEGKSSWTNTSYNIINKGSISISDAIFSQNKASIVSGDKTGGGIIHNSGFISVIENTVFDKNIGIGSNMAWGGIISNSGGVIDTIKNVSFTNNYLYTEKAAPHGGNILNFGDENSESHIHLIDGAVFENNTMTSAANQIGGAHGVGIDNNEYGFIDKITNSKFINNKTYRTGYEEKTGNYHSSAGGLDNYNYIGEISNSLFQGNSGEVQSASASASGGAIMNIYNGNGALGQIDKISNVQFIDNHVLSENGNAHGGAISTGSASTDKSKTSKISVMENVLFKGNYAKSGASGSGYYRAYGGAIDNGGDIGQITGNFIQNYVEIYAGASSGRGGAIFNTGTIDIIEGSFDGNYVVSAESGQANGGAIENSGTIKRLKNVFFSNNFAKSFGGNTYGGVLLNEKGGKVLSVNGTFKENYAKASSIASGGVIHNEASTIGTIESDFIGNYVESLSTSNGGGILNILSTIEKINGNFVENYAKAFEKASGGAINNNKEGKINEGIEGSFIRNHAEAETDFVRGGAVMNFGYIKNIQGDMLENYARTNGTYVIGGALANMYVTASSPGIIDALSGVYANNYAESNGTGSASYAQGGAIYNGANATISNIIDSAFIGNEARGYTDATDGGAIWNAGKITFSGNNIFADNYKTVNGVKTANDIYNKGEINVAENGVLNIGGGISGNGSGKINLNKNAALQLNNSVADGNSVTMADGASLAFNVNAFKTAETAQDGGRFNGDIQLNGKNNLLVSSYVSGGENSGDGLYKFANDVDATNGEWTLSLNNNGLYNMNVSVNDDNNTLLMKYQKKSAQEIANALDMSTEKGIETAALSGPKTDNDIFNNISEIVNNSAQTGNKNLSKMLDDLNDNTQGNAEIARLLNDRISSKIETRLNFRRNERLGVYGLSGGDALQYKPQVWANVIYQSAKNSGDNDFDADTTGFIAGVDGQANENLTLGLGYAYQKTDMKSGAAKTDIATHSVLGYGEYSWKNWFANALLSYNKSSYEQKKNAFSSVLKGDFDVDVLGVQLLTGKNIYTAMGNNRTAIRPQAGVRYYKLNQDDYTDNAGMKYESDDSDILVGVVGVEASMNKQINNLTVTPKVFVNALYDLKNDDSNTLVKLPNGNAYTVSQKSNGKFGIEAGAEMNFAVTENLQTGVAYEYDWKDDYSAHTGMITLKYAF